jgi:hypothetical protein
MSGVFPDPSETHAVVVRTFGGMPVPQVNVSNAYVPSALFSSSEDITALPDDVCNVQLLPKQINAIVSELLSFGERLNPNGNWDQSYLRNIADLFNSWRTSNYAGSLSHTLCSAAQGIPLLDDHLIYCDAGGFLRTALVSEFVAAYIPPPTPPSVQCLSELGGIPSGPNPRMIVDDTTACPSIWVWNCTSGAYVHMFT